MIPERLTSVINLENDFANRSGIVSHKIQRNYLLLILLTFPLLTIFGNLLVVISVVKDRCLRNTTNYYIVSLAIADISLAVTVMPLCTWLEVNNGFWEFIGIYCDIFMMLDVMFCTSSILNLAAISIDRYIAVSRPLSYSNNQKFQRVYITIGITWLLSFLIALPITSGLNDTKDRKDNECKFNNPTFIIVSSMISFYIPSVIVLILYYRIFRIIKKQVQAKIRRRCGKMFENVHIDQPNLSPSTYDDSEMIMNPEIISSKPGSSEENKKKANSFHYTDSYVYCNPNTSNQNTKVSCKDNKFQDGLKEEKSRLINKKINNEKTDRKVKISFLKNYFARKIKLTRKVPNSTEDSDEERLSLKTSNLRFTLQLSTLNTTNLIKSTLMLPMRIKKKNQTERYLARKEKKAIKTLVIVLVVFLMCWAPFFTLNIINAACIKFNLSQSGYVCSLVNSKTGNVAVWLGYTNSCVNPIIYTIFNGEFRRSFRKLLKI